MPETTLTAPGDVCTDTLEELVTDLMTEPEMPVADPPLSSPHAVSSPLLVLLLSPEAPAGGEDRS